MSTKFTRTLLNEKSSVAHSPQPKKVTLPSSPKWGTAILKPKAPSKSLLPSEPVFSVSLIEQGFQGALLTKLLADKLIKETQATSVEAVRQQNIMARTFVEMLSPKVKVFFLDMLPPNAAQQFSWGQDWSNVCPAELLKGFNWNEATVKHKLATQADPYLRVRLEPAPSESSRQSGFPCFNSESTPP